MYSGLSEEQAQQVFAQQMIELSDLDEKDTAETVIMLFENDRAGLDKLSILNAMFINPYMTPVAFKFVISCVEKEPSDYFIDLVNLGDDLTAVQIAKEMVKYLTLTSEEWKELYDLTDNFEDEEYENLDLRQFFKNQIDQLVINNGPDWIKKLPVSKIPVHPKFPSVKEISDQLTKKLTPYKDKNFDDVIKATIAKYAISTSLDKAKMGKFNSKFDDIALFQEFGPVNTLYESNHPYNHECYKYGGCRMFLCCEFKDLDDQGDEIDIMTREEDYRKGWFRNSCDECSRTITKKHHAIRLPLSKGGWRGCFCSFECLGDNCQDQLQLLVIGIMKGQLQTFGIRDR